MGSARSLQNSTFSGLRVASSNYFPAHSKNGVNVSQRCTINAFMNIASKANNGEGRNDVINLTAWGKLADVCAKSMSPGKEFHCSAKLKTFDARVWYNQQPVTMGDGTVLTTKKVGFSITELTFGDESAKHIANEIQSGIRPVDWNAAGAPGYAAWREKLKQRNAMVFDPTQPVFGYAKVILPQGPGIGAYTAQAPAAGAAPVFIPTGAAVEAAVVNAANNPAAVSAALFTPVQTPAAAPVVGAPTAGFATPAGV
jgi:single-stranded DNA-binding protein